MVVLDARDSEASPENVSSGYFLNLGFPFQSWWDILVAVLCVFCSYRVASWQARTSCWDKETSKQS